MELGIAWLKAVYIWQFNSFFNSLLFCGHKPMASGNLNPDDSIRRLRKKAPETAKTSNTRDYHMAKGNRKNIINRNQDHLVSSEPSTPTTASPGYPNTPEKQDSDLKLYLMMLVEDLKKDINNSLKEIQENTCKEVEALKEETQKSLKELQENRAKQVEGLKEEAQKFHKELQENTTKQAIELNKTIQDLQM